MTDGKVQTPTDEQLPVMTGWVALGENGRVESKRYHLYMDCSFIAEQEVEAITERESNLLGLKVCSVCERRKTGGPAVEALAEAITKTQGVIFAPAHTGSISEADKRDAAYNLLDTLKGMGFYIAQRGAKK